MTGLSFKHKKYKMLPRDSTEQCLYSKSDKAAIFWLFKIWFQALEALNFLIERRDFWAQQNPDYPEIPETGPEPEKPTWKQMVAKSINPSSEDDWGTLKVKFYTYKWWTNRQFQNLTVVNLLAKLWSLVIGWSNKEDNLNCKSFNMDYFNIFSWWTSLQPNSVLKHNKVFILS